MKLSIVIPIFNRYKFTKSCLEDLSHLPQDHEIIVVDNGSTDESHEELSKNKRIVYIRNDKNLGFAGACNIGYAAASSNNVLFLNNDIKVQSNLSDWTKPLIDDCNKGLVGPTMGLLDKELNFVKESNSFLEGKSYMSGWCLASSKHNFNKLLLNNREVFSEEFGKAYFEDTDLSFRARKLGIKFIVVEIPVVHFGKKSSSQLNTHKLYSDARKIFIKKWQKHTLK